MKSGSKGIIVYNHKILLILRDNKPDIPYPNTWDWPGGGQEPDESLEQTGLREVKEELGIILSNYFFIGANKHPDRDSGRFIAMLTDQEFKNLHLGNEGQKYDFFTIEEVQKLETIPSLLKFIEDNKNQLHDIIENNKPINSQNFKLINEIN